MKQVRTAQVGRRSIHQYQRRQLSRIRHLVEHFTSIFAMLEKRTSRFPCQLDLRVASRTNRMFLPWIQICLSALPGAILLSNTSNLPWVGFCCASVIRQKWQQWQSTSSGIFGQGGYYDVSKMRHGVQRLI